MRGARDGLLPALAIALCPEVVIGRREHEGLRADLNCARDAAACRYDHVENGNCDVFMRSGGARMQRVSAVYLDPPGSSHGQTHLLRGHLKSDRVSVVGTRQAVLDNRKSSSGSV